MEPVQERCVRLAEAAGPQLKPQVFLSHTGQDETAHHFAASVLKPALELAGLKVVIDCDYLQPGVDWSQELVDAAANSAVFVAVLSRSYSQRFWCMLELDLALNAHQLRAKQRQGSGSTVCPAPWIIPVFLDEVDSIVQPQSICQFWQQAAAAWEAFEVEEVGTLGRRADWADAESWATNTAALLQFQNERRSSYTGKDELHQLARAVVQAAARQLPPLVGAAFGVVGLEERVTQLSGRLGFWLYGTGGQGKTESAKALHNRLWSTGLFQCSAFAEVQHDDGNDLSKVAARLKAALKELTGKEPWSESAAKLAEELKHAVAHRRVLYVLDNVWTPQQLQHLLPTVWGEGSVVVITSRSTSLNSLELRAVEERLLVHAVEPLDSASATELFRLCAGLPKGPPEALQVLEKQLVERCAGLPLALRLVAGGLCGLDFSNEDKIKEAVQEWQDALEALKQGVLHDPELELQGVLEHSLKGMAIEAVSMFLDVVTALRGQSKGTALTVWRAWHGPGVRGWLRQLQERSLVEFSEDDRLAAHDVVVVLGRRKVLDPRSWDHGSRLWVEEGKVMGVPKGVTPGTGALTAQLDQGWRDIQADDPKLQPVEATWVGAGTRILLAGRRGVDVPAMNGLVWMEVAGERWARQLSTVISRNSQLCILRAWNVAGITDLPEVGHLSALQEVDLSRCNQLTALPGGLGQLSVLQTLILAACDALKALPEDLGQLSALQTLILRECGSLEELPEGVGNLHALQQLDLRWCK